MTRKRKLAEIEESDGQICYQKEEELKNPLRVEGDTLEVPQDYAVVSNDGTASAPQTAGGSSTTSNCEALLQTETGGSSGQAKKAPRMKLEDCLKFIELECEWNMCTLKFKKMERLCSHITEHLHAECSKFSSSVLFA
ncbi:hypothetical protein SK128_027444 [Halocaridina rubra]|uniref:Uncharacterized protein n=1 Tax=Halocaridina rubra TaxID=373956 RepID=A0AAN8WGK8_HALRR